MISSLRTLRFQPPRYDLVASDRYERNVDKGITPHFLLNKVHSLPWPIEMDKEKYILNYNGQLVSSGKRIYNHIGIDIMCTPGTPVKPVENGSIVFCELDNRFGVGNEFADVYINSDSNITWVYRHLKKDSIPQQILQMNEYNPESKLPINTNELIGRVGSWVDPPNYMDIIPSHFRRRYKNRPHHLHLEAHINFKELNGEGSFNPLILLKRLSIEPYSTNRNRLLNYQLKSRDFF